MASSSESAEPLSERPTAGNASVPTPFTTFKSSTKHLIIILLALAMLASPLCATIYLPLLPLLSVHFHVSVQAINLTITVYIIFQALAPLFFASISDTLGRRPIYLATFALYAVASLGLALNTTSYAALLVLRALQSLGASAILAVSYGTVADICVSAERGTMLGPVMAATNLGTCIGPILGGWVSVSSGGFQWVFWSLFIHGGVMLAILGLILPETARNVVGDGSIPIRSWRRTWWSLIRSSGDVGPSGVALQDVRDSEKADLTIDTAIDDNGPSTKAGKKLNLRSPLAALRIILYRDTFLILWIAGSFYAVFYCIQASIPSTFKSIYNFNELEIGLAYLPGATGVIIGMYLTGKFMDRNYAATAKSIGHTVDRVAGDNLDNFPIERARTRGSVYILGFSLVVLTGYGWAIQRRVHVAVPLILQCAQGFISTWFLQTFNALLVDVFPETPSTAATASSLTRCALSAGAVALLQPLVDAMGKGWYFTLLGCLSGIGGLFAVIGVQRYGMKWRSERPAKTQRKPRKADRQMDSLKNEKVVHENQRAYLDDDETKAGS